MYVCTFCALWERSLLEAMLREESNIISFSFFICVCVSLPQYVRVAAMKIP